MLLRLSGTKPIVRCYTKSLRTKIGTGYLKQGANSYSASLTFTQSSALGTRVAAVVPPMPNYVWLAMLLLAATLLSGSTLLRARGQVTTAQNTQAVTNSRLAQAQADNA